MMRTATMPAATTAERTYRMLENETLWSVAQRVHELLTAGRIPYAIAGGVAVCLHGYRRNTIDLDLLIRPQDADTLRATLESSAFNWNKAAREFQSSSGVAVQLLMAGEPEGPSQEAVFPNPSDAKR